MIEQYVDREELKRLLSTLVVVLGALVIVALFASIVVPGLRNANKPETPTPVISVIGETGWLDPTEFPPHKGGIIPPVDPRTLLAPSPELTARGKQLFEANCVPCHGPSGHGDGPASATMDPRPRNLTSPNGWTNGYELPGIFKTLTQGVSGTSMASFNYLSKKDRMALAHYVQSLGSFPHIATNPEDLEALSKELAAPGERIPNKIPVSMAMTKLAEEFTAPPPLAIDKNDRSPGADVLRRVLVDGNRASEFLAQSKRWRLGYRELAASVVLETPGNGFSVSSADLSASDWQLLQSELLKRIKTK
jgi:mono/diheme cytochrome c family protein